MELKKSNIFEVIEKEEHEEVIFLHDRRTGLKGILAIHDTTLGPGLGGCRMWQYESEDRALRDVLNLSRGMTYKIAISGLDYGGAKMVLWGDPTSDKNEAYFRALGKFIDRLEGYYIIGPDVGIGHDDLLVIQKETPYVCALPEEFGGSGDISISTAYGTFNGIKACFKKKYGSDSLSGRTVALQGLGKVGFKLAKMLLEEDARVIATDLESSLREGARELGCETVDPEEIYTLECDVFSPNALGGIVNDQTLPEFNCDIIAGAANNILEDPEVHGRKLLERGIIYAPDYVINAGGVIHAASGIDYEQCLKSVINKKCEDIYDTLLDIFAVAEAEQVLPHKAADQIVEQRLAMVEKINSLR